jgi:hypothetical protein
VLRVAGVRQHPPRNFGRFVTELGVNRAVSAKKALGEREDRGTGPLCAKSGWSNAGNINLKVEKDE